MACCGLCKAVAGTDWQYFKTCRSCAACILALCLAKGHLLQSPAGVELYALSGSIQPSLVSCSTGSQLVHLLQCSSNARQTVASEQATLPPTPRA